MSEPLLRLKAVTRTFEGIAGGAGGTDMPKLAVLAGIDLELEAGAALAIVGPSGSGKSTLLNVIGGLDRPTSGAVELGGRDLAKLSADELARVRNEELGFVFQSHHLLPQCTALENVLVPTLVCRDAAKRAAAPERARKLLERAGLGARLEHRPAQLSGGECQRVAVVRALIHSPRLVLADEPTGSLDSVAADSVGELLLELNGTEGCALIVVTHSPELAARVGRVARIHDGRLEAAGAPSAS